jgi:hypothetical protein
MKQPVGSSHPSQEHALTAGPRHAISMDQSHDAGPYPFRDHAVNSAWRGQAGRWIEVRLPSSADAGEVLAMLDDPTVAGAWEEQQTTRLYWSRENWKPKTLDQLQQAVRQLTGHSGSVTIETLDDRIGTAYGRNP